MHDLNDLYYFAQVVQHRGFAAAGRALGVPKSKLSRRIALLEERLGVKLLYRSTRRFSVTEIGQTFYTHCRAMLIEAEAAEEAIALTRSEPRGILRVTCPVALLDAQLGAMLIEFMRAHPLVTVHLEATNRRVDVISEGVDVAIRVRPPPLEDSELQLRVLASRGQCLVACPALLARHGTPAAPADLHRLPSLDLGIPQNAHAWHLLGPDGAAATSHHQPRLVTRGMATLRAAAIAGLGIVQLPRMMIREPIARGELVAVIPHWTPRRETVHAVFASRRGLLPAVRAFIDHLAARFAQLPAE
jgi:DNA-binding transcriptional LysR family regulator